MRVLILGARAPACLEWARAFVVAGWEVSVADSLDWPVTSSSRAVHDYIRLPEPRKDPGKWITTLVRVAEERDIDLILPTCEEVFYLAYGRSNFPSRCRIMTGDIEMMHRLHHKYLFAMMSLGWPVSAPESWLLETSETIWGFRDMARELVFKPAYSRFASRTLIKPSYRELSQIKPTKEQPWVAQRFIPGQEYCSYSLLSEGRLTAHSCYTPGYRVGKGSGIYFPPADPPQIQAFVERFGAETGYTGQIGFDFIESDTGEFYVLECNPRATSGIHLFDDRHVELVAALLGERKNELLLPNTTPRMVALAMLLFAMPRHIFDPMFWRDFYSARDVITRPKDQFPLLAQIPGLMEIVCRALMRRQGLLAAATTDIEWDGEPMEIR